MRTQLYTLLIAIVSLVLANGCVSQRTLDGKSQPAQQFDAQEAAQTRLALGLQYLRSGNFEQAKANLERALSYTPDNPDVYTGLAFYYQQVRDPQQAESYYRQALKLQPTDGNNYNNLGVLLCNQGRFAEAEQQFQRAIDQPGYVKVAGTYENLARCANLAGQWQLADQYYQLALNHSGGSVAMLESYATFLLAQGNYPKAAEVIAQRADFPQLSASYLWLEVQLAHAQRNNNKRDEFGALLLSRFPQSDQARNYQQLNK